VPRLAVSVCRGHRKQFKVEGQKSVGKLKTSSTLDFQLSTFDSLFVFEMKKAGFLASFAASFSVKRPPTVVFTFSCDQLRGVVFPVNKPSSCLFAFTYRNSDASSITICGKPGAWVMATGSILIEFIELPQNKRSSHLFTIA